MFAVRDTTSGVICVTNVLDLFESLEREVLKLEEVCVRGFRLAACGGTNRC